MATKPDNTKVTRKRGGRSSTTWKKGDPSPNPKGAPKRGQSWAEVIKAVSELTPKDAVKLLGDKGDLTRAFTQMPQTVELKTLVVLRVFSAMMFEPQASLWSHVLERSEGKVPQTINVGWESEVLQLWRSGSITEDDIKRDLGDDLAREFFKSAGAAIAALGALTGDGAPETNNGE